jgi:D-lyxose ketol-isomerase
MMKRSTINQILRDAKAFMAERQFLLPPWSNWSREQWLEHKSEASEIIKNKLGWDITDFGSGNFYKQGLLLFTIRNGSVNVDKKPYAEKIMIVEENQETPMHYHWSKMEDIINRGGGNLIIELFKATPDNGLSNSRVDIKVDGIRRTISGGEKIILTPGESICLEQKVYHRFYGESGKGKVLVGEVSSVNDDRTDNCFYESYGRFPDIEEDEPPLHLLVGDYGRFL